MSPLAAEVFMGQSLSEVSRREERIYVTLPVTLRTGWQGATEVNGNTVDYSERGLRVRASAPLRVRQDVEVIVSDNPTLKRNYSVMWVREPSTDQSVYEAGLEVDRDRPE
ncbi:MAG: PilZ domain-containing protein [Acidobacteriia bacterium]|nr:PilZ domain-containing protein [Terriglobia bacterium]